MPDKSASYFEERAEEELEMAQRATHPKAVKAHYELAGFYLDRVHGAPEETEQTNETTPADNDQS
jgi:hypothetical protein